MQPSCRNNLRPTAARQRPPRPKARRPQVLLVGELAHTHAPGSKRAHLIQGLEALVDSVVAVYSTLNIHHLANLKDRIAVKPSLLVLASTDGNQADLFPAQLDFKLITWF